MATLSSVLAWRIPGTGEPGGLYGVTQSWKRLKRCCHSSSSSSPVSEFRWLCCCSVTQSWSTLCDPMDCSTPGLPILCHLPEFALTHVHWGNDAIQPSHPLSPPSPSALNLSQHQGLFQWVSSSHGGQSIGTSASVFSINIQGWFPLELADVFSLQSKGFSRVFSSITIWKHQLF